MPKKAVNEGIKEIWLTSQDTGCYGFDINTNLPTLLKELVKIPGDFKIRVGMMNPDHMSKIQTELIECYKHPKIFKFLQNKLVYYFSLDTPSPLCGRMQIVSKTCLKARV